MVVYVTVPGITGSGERHWQTLWERQWGAAAIRIQPRSWSHPDLADWVAAIDHAVEEAAARDSEVILIAHSLGCWAASDWLRSSAAGHVRGALLVAPPDQRSLAFPAEDASTFVGLEARTLPCKSMVVASADDPYCSSEAAEGLARDWGSVLHVVGELGHLNSASDLGDWPQGRALLNQLGRV